MSGQDTDISEGIIGRFLVRLVEEMCNSLSTPRRHDTFSDLFGRSIGVWMIAQAASRYDPPHPKWASCIDGAILREDNC